MNELHKIVEAWRSLCRLSNPMLQINSRSIRAGNWGLFPVGFWMSPAMESLQPLWAACSSMWPPSQSDVSVKLKYSFPIPWFVPIASCPFTVHPWEESGSVFLTWDESASLTYMLEVFIHIEVFLRLFLLRLNCPSSLSFFQCDRCLNLPPWSS